jgi:hypothetical protein
MKIKLNGGKNNRTILGSSKGDERMAPSKLPDYDTTEIKINQTDWQDPIVHANRARNTAKKLSMFIDPFDEVAVGLYTELVEEIENLYHSFYMN